MHKKCTCIITYRIQKYGHDAPNFRDVFMLDNLSLKISRTKICAISKPSTEKERVIEKRTTQYSISIGLEIAWK